MLIVVMGVMGSGKSTLAEALARSLAWAYEDADDHHDAAARDKLARGIPLEDADRGPWLSRLAALLAAADAEGRSLVLACSALKARYRERLRVSDRVRFVFLDGAFEELLDRLRGRRDHFADTSLLRSQLEALETPGRREALCVPVSASVEDKVARIREALGLGPSGQSG